MANLNGVAKWLEEQQPEPEVLFLRELLEKHDTLLRRQMLKDEEFKELQTRSYQQSEHIDRLKETIGVRADDYKKLQEKLGKLRQDLLQTENKLTQALVVIDQVRGLNQAYTLWLREQPAPRRSRG